jgi:hypothetical protein
MNDFIMLTWTKHKHAEIAKVIHLNFSFSCVHLQIDVNVRQIAILHLEQSYT